MNRERSCGCIILKDGKVLLIGARDDDGELFWAFMAGLLIKIYCCLSLGH